jgi:N4-gp56 family major capsid protein
MGYSSPAPLGTQFTSNTSSVFIPEIWMKDLIRHRDISLVLKDAVSPVNFSGGKGDTIYIPYVSNLGVNNKAQGAPVTYQAFTENRWTMTVNRYKEVSFAIDKFLEVFADRDLRAIYTERAGYALARDIEFAILAERATINGYNSGSQVVSNSSSGLTYADILAAMEIMDKDNVPREGRRLIIDPSQHYSLLAQDEFISADYNTGNAVSTGEVGRICGVPVKMTTSLSINSTTGYTNGEGASGQPTPGMSNSPYYPTQSPVLRSGASVTASALTANYHTAMLVHPDWCKLAMKKMPSVDADWSVDYQEWHVVQTQIYDVEVYRPEACVLINTDEDALV